MRRGQRKGIRRFRFQTKLILLRAWEMVLGLLPFVHNESHLFHRICVCVLVYGPGQCAILEVEEVT
jgi:hypothetical protein